MHQHFNEVCDLSVTLLEIEPTGQAKNGQIWEVRAQLDIFVSDISCGGRIQVRSVKGDASAFYKQLASHEYFLLEWVLRSERHSLYAGIGNMSSYTSSNPVFGITSAAFGEEPYTVKPA